MTATLIRGNARSVLELGLVPRESCAAVVTSPPYFGQRTYTTREDEIGKPSRPPAEYVRELSGALDACSEALIPGGVLFVNLGDTYNAYNRNRGPGGRASARRDESRAIQESRGLLSPGHPNKTALALPHRLAISMMDEHGWVLRGDITWVRHTLPERVRDRPRRASERLLMFTRSPRYVARVPKDRPDLHTDVWSLPPARGKSEHPARFNEALSDACLAWIPGDVPGAVLDPFSGSGTTGVSAAKVGRDYYGIDISETFTSAARERLA